MFKMIFFWKETINKFQMSITPDTYSSLVKCFLSDSETMLESELHINIQHPVAWVELCVRRRPQSADGRPGHTPPGQLGSGTGR